MGKGTPYSSSKGSRWVRWQSIFFLNGHKTKCRSHPSQSLPVCRWTYWSPQSQNDLPRVTHLAGSKSRVTPQVSYSRAPLTAEILRMQQHNPNIKTISLLSHWTSYSTKCFFYFCQIPTSFCTTKAICPFLLMWFPWQAGLPCMDTQVVHCTTLKEKRKKKKDLFILKSMCQPQMFFSVSSSYS